MTVMLTPPSIVSDTAGPAQVTRLSIILARLAKTTGREPTPTKRVGGYTADCPNGHFGTAATGSLHVREAKDGRIVFVCSQGCDTPSIVRAIGLKVDDLFPASPSEEDPDALPRAVRAIEPRVHEPLVWCVEDVLIASELAVFAGDGGSFKSTGGFHMAAAIAGGYSAFNRFPTRQSPTLILSAEDGDAVVHNRLEAIVQGHGWDRDRVLSNVHILATHDAKLSSPEWQQHILAECRRLAIGFTLFDPWADLISGEENSNSEQRPIIHFCRSVATATRGPVVVVAHAAKTREGQRSIDRVRGASALRDAARCVLFFESRPEGISVEHLKMSRSEKLAPFTISREIIATPESRAIWSSARFSFQTANEAILSRAESFVLDQVTAAPGTLKTTDLRTRGAVVGIHGEDMARALTHLQARGLLDYTPGPRGAKMWTAIPDPQNCENRRNGDFFEPAGRLPDPADPAGTLPGSLADTRNAAASQSQPAAPFRGRGQAGGSAAPGQAADAEPESVEIPEEFDLRGDP